MKRALIDPRSNRVCEIVTADFPVAPPLYFIDAPDNIDADDNYDGVTFTKRPSNTKTFEQTLLERVNSDPLLKAQILEIKERKGFTRAQLVAYLETKAGEIV